MTRDYHEFVKSSLAAERAGDAATALEYHRGVPMFARSRHVSILEQLVDLSGEMSPWLWARWAAYQCHRTEDVGESARITRAALDYTARMFYADRFEDAFLEGEDHVPLLAVLGGESWIYHQLCAFEMGGLHMFLADLVTGRLADEIDLARRWVDASMNGYRLRMSAAGLLVAHDLRARRDLELLDLGAAVHADDGGWLLGRVVASGTTPGLMFDTRPVAVDELTARTVAVDPTPAGWINALKAAIDDGRVDRRRLEAEDLELVTDVPSLSLVEVGTPAAAMANTMDSLRNGRDEVGRAAFRILRDAGGGRFGPDARAPYVAAAVLNPHGYAEARRHLSGAAPSEWLRWADLVPKPARRRLRLLAGLDETT